MGHLRRRALKGGGGAVEHDRAAVTGGVELLPETGVMRYRLVERAVVKGRTGTGIGTGSGGGTKGAVAATQKAGVTGLRDRVCILHGRLWPRGHRHGDKSGSGER